MGKIGFQMRTWSGIMGVCFSFVLNVFLNSQIEDVESTPNHKGPVGAVPLATNEHGKHYIDVSADNSFAIASQWDIQIIAKPG